MKLHLVYPRRADPQSGNLVTASRWARILRSLGHRITLSPGYHGEACDALIALHARKSRASIRSFHRDHPHRPLIVALTGTDLYADLGRGGSGRRSLELATRLVALQRAALRDLPEDVRHKARVILQSAVAPPSRERPPAGEFRVCVIGHLRPVKDPFRAAMAARLLPESSRIRVLHLGRAMTPSMRLRALRETARRGRYRWLGELSRDRVLRILAGSHLMVLSSRLEGGANVLSEAIVCGVPVLVSRIPGSLGILGGNYPGAFSFGDTKGLAELMGRCEADPGFTRRLRRRVRVLAARFLPERERRDWRRLLGRIS